mmetsp:Transcript_18643/g.70809  ORF Transcript_18643/g.70809 Transcript_18643/m.70809 type:complete len:679 (+) Transcript_18643:280-2316(+)
MSPIFGSSRAIRSRPVRGRDAANSCPGRPSACQNVVLGPLSGHIGASSVWLDHNQVLIAVDDDGRGRLRQRPPDGRNSPCDRIGTTRHCGAPGLPPGRPLAWGGRGWRCRARGGWPRGRVAARRGRVRACGHLIRSRVGRPTELCWGGWTRLGSRGCCSGRRSAGEGRSAVGWRGRGLRSLRAPAQGTRLGGRRRRCCARRRGGRHMGVSSWRRRRGAGLVRRHEPQSLKGRPCALCRNRRCATCRAQSGQRVAIRVPRREQAGDAPADGLAALLAVHHGRRVEHQRHAARAAVKPVLPDVDSLGAVDVLQDEHRVRLLRGLGRAEHRVHGQRLAVALLAGVNHQSDVHVGLGGERAELVDCGLLRLKAVHPPGRSAHHELQVVEHDVRCVVRVRGVLHSVDDVIHLGRAKVAHEGDGQPLKGVRGRLHLGPRQPVERPAHVLVHHGPQQSRGLHLERAPERGHSLRRQVHGQLREQRGLAGARGARQHRQLASAVALHQRLQRRQHPDRVAGERLAVRHFVHHGRAQVAERDDLRVGQRLRGEQAGGQVAARAERVVGVLGRLGRLGSPRCGRRQQVCARLCRADALRAEVPRHVRRSVRCAHEEGPGSAQLAGHHLRPLPAGAVLVHPQVEPLEALEPGKQLHGEGPRPVGERHGEGAGGLVNGHGVELALRHHHC